jgi:transposase
MTHRNAPLTPTGRLRLVLRHLKDGIPKAHVAAEFRVSRPTVSTWVARYLAAGEAGLADRPSTPRRSPQRTPAAVVELIESLRRERCQGLGRQGRDTVADPARSQQRQHLYRVLVRHREVLPALPRSLRLPRPRREVGSRLGGARPPSPPPRRDHRIHPSPPPRWHLDHRGPGPRGPPGGPLLGTSRPLPAIPTGAHATGPAPWWDGPSTPDAPSPGLGSCRCRRT